MTTSHPNYTQIVSWLKRTLVYASVSYRSLPDTERVAFIGVADKLIAVCDKLLEKDESLVLPQHSLIGAARHDFEFRATCGIEELPALLLSERFPLEMVMTTLEKSIGEINLVEVDIVWTKEPFAVTWEDADCVTPRAREAFEKHLRTFGLHGTWKCQEEEKPNLSIWLGACMFFVDYTKILVWSRDGLWLNPRTKLNPRNKS